MNMTQPRETIVNPAALLPARRTHSIMDDNAMTEIALALAMGFFAIMILTLVSMGAGEGGAGEGRASVEETTKTEVENQASVITAALTTTEKSQIGDQVVDTPKGEDLLVIYFDGQFMDQNLQPIFPEAVKNNQGGKIILALNPSLPMQEALDARAKLNVKDLVVATLDERWMERLQADTK
ncbi:MAG: hypothetical protein R3261_10365 [Alphaproteobacteria bacterium]|nr:hypothetical protein [Alphaproteobacteria bacterium]